MGNKIEEQAELREKAADIVQHVDPLKTPEMPDGNPFFPGNLSHQEATDAIMSLIEAELTEANAKHDEIYKWLLGESGDFPLSEPGKRYNWRTELRRRLAELNKGKEGNHE